MSFEELVKRISPILKRITYKLNGHFSFFNDEDLFQEALVFLWDSFKKGKLDDKTDSYILQGCYFYLKNYLRKVGKRVRSVSIYAKKEEDTSFEETLLLDDGCTQKFLDYLDSKLLIEAILNNGLTKREKDVFSLCAEGLTTREIGKRLGISHVRVVKLRSNIKRKSKYLLNKFNIIC